MHPDDLDLVQQARRGALSGPTRAVYRFHWADGAYRWTEALSTAARKEDEQLVVSTVRDLGDRKEAEIDPRRRATTDPLTGVANRTVLMDRLGKRAATTPAARRPRGVLFSTSTASS